DPTPDLLPTSSGTLLAPIGPLVQLRARDRHPRSPSHSWPARGASRRDLFGLLPIPFGPDRPRPVPLGSRHGPSPKRPLVSRGSPAPTSALLPVVRPSRCERPFWPRRPCA